MNRIGKMLIAVCLMSTLSVSTVLAVPSSSDLKDEQAAVKAEVNSLQAQLEKAFAEIEQLEKDIEQKQKDVDAAGREVDIAEQNEYEQYEAMKLRIKYMYEESSSSQQLENILNAKNIVDMLNQATYVDELYTYDREKLEEYERTKIEVKEKHELFAAQLEDLEESQVVLNDKKDDLSALISSKQNEIASLDAEIAEAVAREVEEARIREEQRLAALAAQEAANSNNNNNNSNSGSSNSGSSGGSQTVPPASSNNGTASGAAVVSYAMQFIGNKYVYGGNSLTNGIDCSGFTQQVYRQFGYSIPRTSSSQRSAGVGVSYSEAQPGDLICYSGHVGIYIGGGQIVHASNSSPYPKGGIKTGSATYRTILAVRRIV